jgi:hypothetical protein
MKLAAFITISMLAVGAYAQGVPQFRLRPQPIQIKIRHADPWAVKTLLEGGELRAPELSTILALMGGTGGQGGQGGQGGAGGGRGGAGGAGGRGGAGGAAGGQGGDGRSPLFPGGRFIINPGDNSLWFIPDQG